MVLAVLAVTVPWLSSAAGAVPAFTRVTVDPDFFGDNKAIADIDGDRLPDIVIGGSALVWYRAPAWSKSVIAVPVNEFTTDMQAADVDRDGDVDLVTPDHGAGIYWFSNPRVGGGAWTKEVVSTAVTTAHDVEVADIDGSGTIDVATRGHGGPTHVFLQGATGGWSMLRISTAEDGEGMALADIDRDGDVDVAQNGYWLEAPNPITGSWPRHDIAGGWQSYTSVHATDLDRDGDQDVVLASSESTGRLAWYRAPADPKAGGWTEHVVDSSVDYVHATRAADMDGDGDLDIAMAEMQQSDRDRVGYYENDGTSLAWALRVVATTGSHNIRVADIGNDGDADIVGANWQGAPVDLWENQLNPRLPLDRWAALTVTTSQVQTFGLATGDLDRDGRRDIVSGPYWYRNPGGDLTGAWTQSAAFPDGVHAVLVADVDGDTLSDVIGQRNSGTEVVWLEATSGSAGAWVSRAVGSLPQSSHIGMQGYRMEDLDGGGRPEVVLSSGGGIYYFRIPADPTTPWSRVLVNANPTDEGFGAGDIDRDGDIDLAAGTAGKTVEWYRNPGTGVENWPAFPLGSVPEFGWPDRFEVADFDGDGRLDVVGTEENGGESADAQTYWWAQPADPAGGSWTRALIAEQYTTNSLDVADIDRDGDTDLVTGEHRGTEKVTIWENDGRGGFTGRLVDTGKESHLGTRLHDLDNDRDLDIVSIAYDDFQTVRLWRNDAITGGAPSGDVEAPSAPTGLSATAAGATRVDLSWTAATDNVAVDHYEVLRGGAVLATTPTTAFADTTVAPASTYSYTVRARDAAGNTGPESSPASVTTPALPTGPRVTDGLQALYTFKEGTGSTVRDVGGVGSPLDLRILDSTKVRWSTGTNGGVSFTAAGSAIKSDTAATKLVTAAKASNQLTLEAWVTPANLTQGGPARIATISQGTSSTEVDVHLGQAAGKGSYRLRTSSNSFSALEPDAVFTDTTRPWHVAVTYDGSVKRMYVNGTQHATVQSVGGGFSTWDANYPLTLGNEATLDRSWLGSMHLVAFYARSLTDAEVRQNFDAGLSVTSDTTAPSIPQNVAATATSATRVDLSWQASTDDTAVAGYDVLRDGTKVGTTSATTFADTTVTADTAYSYAVRAFDAAGNVSPLSAPADVVTPPPPDTQPPSAPSALTATARTATRIDLAWTASTDNVGVSTYRVLRNGALLAETADTAHVDASAAPATTYTYVVRAVDAAGTVSADSNAASATTPALPDEEAPAVAVTAPAAGAVVSGTVTVTATATDNVGVARVDFRVDGTLAASDTAAPYEYPWDSTAVPNGSHVLSAAAFDAAGNRADSSEVSVTVENDTTPPSAPGGLAATAVSPVAVDLTWQPSADNVGVTGYRVARDGASIATLPGGTTAYSDTGLAPGTWYAYTVVAVDAAGNVGPAAGPLSVRTPADTTSPSTSLTSPASGATVSGAVTVAATATDDVGVLRVEVWLDGTLMATDTTAPYQFPWNTASVADGVHNLQSRAYDAAGNVGSSAVVSVTVTNTPTRVFTDTFGTSTLTTGWSFVNPLADATHSLTKTPGHLEITVPAKRNHDCWEIAECARMMRDTVNEDAVYETKIDGVNLTASIQNYGILLWQDSRNYLLLEYFRSGSTVQVAAWKIIGGVGSQALALKNVTMGSSNYLRVTRQGSTYTLRYGRDGSTWTTAGSFTQNGFAVKQVGVHVGNDGSKPATTARFDYFTIR